MQLIEIMQSTYKKLLSKFCVGKKFLEMQHSWLRHINYYVQGAEAVGICGLPEDDKMKLHDVWKAFIVEAAKINISLCDVEQRIIVSSLANNRKALTLLVGLSWPEPPPKMATFSKHNPL